MAFCHDDTRVAFHTLVGLAWHYDFLMSRTRGRLGFTHRVGQRHRDQGGNSAANWSLNSPNFCLCGGRSLHQERFRRSRS